MGDVFSADITGMASYSAANHAAGGTISAASSADSSATFGAAAAAIGPIGTHYLAAFAPALNNNLEAARHLSSVHHAIGHATASSKAAIIASDDA